MRLGLATLLLAFASSAFAQPVAEIVTLDGSGDFREAQQPSWFPAKVKQNLFPTNFVRTGDQSRMGLLFADKTQLRLAPNSVLQIKEAAKGPDTKTILNLNAGRSWVQSKAAPKGLVMETPSALAAIRGTDWEMVVDAEGRATLSVFSGEVDFSNEQGGVTVQRGEQARAEKGKAPVKLQLTVSRDRMQWVSALTLDPGRYGSTPGTALLQQADAEMFAGDMAAAGATLKRGQAQFPDDDRFVAGLSRVALLSGDGPGALALARETTQRRPRSVEAWLARGDAARREGLGDESANAYRSAIDLASGDSRGWLGLGAVQGERDDLRHARGALSKSLELRDSAEAAAELGTVETLASRQGEARAAFERALAIQPDHYVAWTGLGILHLRSGDTDAAVEVLSKAGVVEPRYSRAHLYLAVAHYNQGRFNAARDELARAIETDPNDPVPHLLASQMGIDALQLVGAAFSAREALARMPFAKSLDAVADNSKGIANAGAPLAQLGLEDWARSAAHDAYYPSWGGSHLFLADRYPGDFNRRSELMQGFVTDPLAFGASNRFQSLVPMPGHHATASVRYGRSDDFTLVEPVLTANGLVPGDFPLAYFVEAVDTRVRPGSLAFSARAHQLTAALGMRPVHELSIFAYANRLSIDTELGKRGESGAFNRIEGTAERLDAGARYAVAPGHDVWVKAGAGREETTSDTLTSLIAPGLALERGSVFKPEPRTRDASARYTGRFDPRLEVTLAADAARWESPATFVGDSALHTPGTASARDALDQRDVDRSKALLALARIGSPALYAELGAQWRDYRKDRAATVTLANGTVTPLQAGVRDRGTDPLAGLVWKPAAGHTARLACREWLRPASNDTLAPVALAGVPVEDQLVFSGGKLRQCRVQWDWTLSHRAFVSAYYEHDTIENLVGSDGVLNTRAELTNLARLRNRVVTPPAFTDAFEDVPIFAEARVRRAHASFEAILTRTLAARLHYTRADSFDTDPDPFFNGNQVPWLPRHRADVGLVWVPGWHTQVTANATWRSLRYVDEANSTSVPKGWDARVSVFVESADKRWAVEAYAYNLMKKETSDAYGVVASWRF